MSDILLIEDDNEKAKNIADFLNDRYIVNEIVVAKSFQSGLLAALESKAKLILLDMTMTNFERSPQEDGGRPHHFAGREILRQMLREGVHIPVIVVTQYGRFGEESEEVTLSELQTELRGKFSDYLGTIHYRSNVDEWKNKLDAMIGALLERRV